MVRDDDVLECARGTALQCYSEMNARCSHRSGTERAPQLGLAILDGAARAPSATADPL